jgi:hypothetical protein
LPLFRSAKIFVNRSVLTTLFLESIRFGEIYISYRSVLAIYGSLFGSPEEAEKLLLAAVPLRSRRRGVGRLQGQSPARGRGASTFLGGSDPYQPEVFFKSIRFSANFQQ